jgi:hypothetical protein
MGPISHVVNGICYRRLPCDMTPKLHTVTIYRRSFCRFCRSAQSPLSRTAPIRSINTSPCSMHISCILLTGPLIRKTTHPSPNPPRSDSPQ